MVPCALDPSCWDDASSPSDVDIAFDNSTSQESELFYGFAFWEFCDLFRIRELE